MVKEITVNEYIDKYYGDKEFLYVKRKYHGGLGLVVKNNAIGKLIQWAFRKYDTFVYGRYAKKVRKVRQKYRGMNAPVDELWR